MKNWIDCFSFFSFLSYTKVSAVSQQEESDNISIDSFWLTIITKLARALHQIEERKHFTNFIVTKLVYYNR